MGEEESWTTWLRRASDAELEQFAAELTEELPLDDPMIIQVRYWLRRLRDDLRGEADSNPGGLRRRGRAASLPSALDLMAAVKLLR